MDSEREIRHTTLNPVSDLFGGIMPGSPDSPGAQIFSEAGHEDLYNFILREDS